MWAGPIRTRARMYLAKNIFQEPHPQKHYCATCHGTVNMIFKNNSCGRMIRCGGSAEPTSLIWGWFVTNLINWINPITGRAGGCFQDYLLYDLFIKLMCYKSACPASNEHNHTNHRSEGFPNGIFGSCAWWSRGLTRSGELLGRRRRRRRHRFSWNTFPKWIPSQMCLDSKELLQGYHVHFSRNMLPKWILSQMS